MPALTNNRRELFAQLLFQGFTAVDAYDKAGFKRHSGNASTLSRDPEIVDRVEAIRAEAEAALVPVGTAAIAARANISVEDLLHMQDEFRLIAKETRQVSAGNNAVKHLAILSGKWVERAEIGGPGEFDHLSDEEL